MRVDTKSRGKNRIQSLLEATPASLADCCAAAGVCDLAIPPDGSTAWTKNGAWVISASVPAEQWPAWTDEVRFNLSEGTPNDHAQS